MSFADFPPIKAAAGSGVLASSVGDPEGTRTIWSVVALLIVLGIGLVMLAVWLFKVTRPDKELLAPLEVMGERKWRRGDPVWQRRRLDEVRSPMAQPLQPSAAPPDFDEAFDLGPAGSGFDDLHDDAHQPEVAQPELAEEPDVTQAEVAADAPPVDVADAPPVDAADAEAPKPADESEATGNGEAGDRPGGRRPTSPTPLGIERPMELPEREIDPQILAAAMAELDAELRLGRDSKPENPN